MKHENLAVELLRKLLADEIKTRSHHNLVQSRSFAELLAKSVLRHQNRVIEAAQVIEELIRLAKEMLAAGRRGVDLGLSNDEVAFYDALEVNDSAVQVLGDATLETIARELVETVRRNVTTQPDQRRGPTHEEDRRARAAGAAADARGGAGPRGPADGGACRRERAARLVDDTRVHRRARRQSPVQGPRRGSGQARVRGRGARAAAGAPQPRVARRVRQAPGPAPVSRGRGVISRLGEVLNVDGYEMITLDRAAELVVLNAPLLRQSFGL